MSVALKRLLQCTGAGVAVLSLALVALVFWGGFQSRLDLPTAFSNDGSQRETGADHGFSAWGSAAANPYLKSRIALADRAGLAIAAAVEGRVSFSAAHGSADLETRAPITAATRFRIASMTKPIVAAAAMALVERGELALDDQIAAYIPAFADARVATSYAAELTGGFSTEPLARPITVEDLLTFTAGIGAASADRDNSGLGARWEEVLGPMHWSAPLADLADAIAALPLYNQPGEAWRYGMSLTVLGRVMEVATGDPLDEVLEELVFAPLGMADTGFMPPPGARKGLAGRYTHRGGRLARLEDPPYDAVGRISGDGGLVSTLPDYLRFALMLWNRGEYGGVRLLSEASVDAMTTPHVSRGVLADFGVDGLGWGYGLAVVVDADASPLPDRNGDFFWQGINGTQFWVSPSTGYVQVYMTQYRPSDDAETRPRGAEIPFVAQGILMNAIQR